MSEALTPNSQVGRFVVITRIGEGEKGIVYVAQDPVLNQKVALKVLHGEVPEDGYREARVLVQLNHPNVINVHDVGQFEGRMFIAMEHVDGACLSEVLRSNPAWSKVLELFIAAGRGLAAAHAAGVVHRDFTTRNVMVGKDGHVRVLDFGLARGTQVCLSPERFQDGACDARSDQFSFCVRLWEGLYGKGPFRAESDDDLRENVINGRITFPTGHSNVSAAVHAAMIKGLSPLPADRFESMDALVEALTPKSNERSRWALPLSIATMGIALAIGLQVFGTSPCSGLSMRLAEVWGPARKTEVRTALLATNKPFAAEAWTSVDRILDAYAGAWIAQRQSVCEATQVRKEQSPAVHDLRVGCLEQLRQELDAVAATLTKSDAKLAERAVQLVSSLSPLTPCAQADVLTARTPLPADPKVRERLEKIGVLLAKGRALKESGSPALALPVADEAVAAANFEVYAPLQAQAQLLLGQVQQLSHAPLLAKNAYFTAVTFAEAGRDLPAKVQALGWLANVNAEELKDLDQAEKWLALAEGAAADDLQKAFIDENRAVVLRAQKKPALTHVEAALEKRERVLGKEHLEVARTLDVLADVHAEAGDFLKAEESWGRSLELKRKLLGPRHPGMAWVLVQLGSNAHRAGDHAKAIAFFDEALPIFTDAFGPEHPMLTLARANLGQVQEDVGNVDAATESFRKVLASHELELGADHLLVASDLNRLAGLLRQRKEYEEAERLLERALKIQKNARTSFALGEVRLALGKFEEALPPLEDALHASERGPETLPWLADNLTAIALAHVELGAVPKALPVLQRALKAYEEDGVKGAAQAELLMARCLWPKERKRALTFAHAAKKRLIAERQDVAPVDAWLAGKAK